MFDQIEKLKREFTDKYVEVSDDRPELARFQGYTGQVKTVNMSGRAPVQFEAWNNIGWYDIDVDFLTVVPKPDPEAKKEVKKPAAVAPANGPAEGGKKVSALEAARAQGAAKKEGAAPAKAAVAKPAGGKMSTADILAAARAKTTGAKPAAEPAGEDEAAPVEEAPVAAKPAKSAAIAGGTKGSSAELVKLPTPEKIAYCRTHDAK